MRIPIFILIILVMTSCYKSGEADLIIHNATIYSCDEDFTIYEAMAIKDGKIVQMGPEREILNGYKCDNIVDAGKKPIYPGFHDAHCHFGGYAKTLKNVDLTGTKTFDELVARVVEFDKEFSYETIFGRGWDQTMWPENEFPLNDTLNKLFPNTPIYLSRVDGHAALVNQKALDLAGLKPDTLIEGGKVFVENGKCTGVLIDKAAGFVRSQLGTGQSEEEYESEYLQLLQMAEEDLFEVGLTSIDDAGISPYDRDLKINWYKNGDLKIKNYSMLGPHEENLKFASDSGDYVIGNLHIRSFKLYSDGALGSRGACLIDPYSDDPENYGLIINDTTELREIAEFAAEIGYQINTHCIGDSANRIILKIYEDAIGSINDHRWRIEHAQVIHEDDFKYFEMYKIIPSVQPTHATSDMRWAEDRLGPHRVKYAYAYQKLLEKAGMVSLGTDFPVERIYPLETFYAAIARMDREGSPEGGFQMEDALSREDALRGMTIWPAYSNFENHKKGSLEAGKDADFVILTKDIMKIPVEEILTTFVEYTYLDGELVYSAE